MNNDDSSLVPRNATIPDATETRLLTARDVVRPLFRHRRAGWMTFVALAALVVLAALLWPRRYTAEMKILVKRDRMDVGTGQAPLPPSEVTENEVNSEVVLLQSRDLLEDVVRASGLVPATAARDRMAVSRAVASLNRHLKVAPLRKTALIDVQYTAADPQAAARVLRTLARLYLEKHLAVNRPPGAREFFDQQARRLQQELNEAQRRLVDFGKAQHVASAASERDATLQKLADFESTLEQVRAQIADNTRRLGVLQQEAQSTPPRLTTAKRRQDNPELLRDLRGKVLDLEMKRGEMLSKFTEAYPPVVELEKQLAQAKSALASAERAPLNDETTDDNPTYRWLRNEMARVQAERDALQARAAATAATVREYRDRAMRLDEQGATEQDLVRAVKAAEENYLLYQRKAEESRIADALDQRRIANVAVAEAATVPALPNTGALLLLVGGLALAIVLSLGLVFLLEYFDPRFRSRHEIETVLELPVLAAIPSSFDAISPRGE